MKITSILLGMLFLICISSLAGCSSMGSAEQEGKQEFAFAQIDRHDVLYTCNCGPQCNCNTVSTKPGKCACGVTLKWGHVLKIDGTDANLCQCGEGCYCYGLNPQDPTKCTCGVKTRRVSLQGTGTYFCNCGSSCFCNTVSGSPGKCKCGRELIKAE